MLKTLSLVIMTLIAFAANSLFCRLALLNNDIDPVSFTAIRLLAGSITLLTIVRLFAKEPMVFSKKRHSFGALFLLVYALAFSLAYIQLNTATGALILFGAVQFTMIAATQIRGQALSRWEWIGVFTAIVGFLFLTLPKFITPSWQNLLMMLLSGIAWGLYTLNGKGSQQAMMDTTVNFVIATLPMLLIMVGFFFLANETIILSFEGILLAIASGAFASGIGYSLWYQLLPTITTTQAATGQLMVPILAGMGGILFVGEALSLHLVIAGGIILLGIYITIVAKQTS